MFSKKLSFPLKVVVFAVSIFILLFGTAIFLSAEQVKAAGSGDVVINEIMWTGSSASSTDEWIELRNTSSTDIDLTNWLIDNVAGGAGIDIDATSCSPFSTSTISAGGYYLIAKYASSSANSCLNANVQCVFSQLSFNDNYSLNGALVLKDSSSNVIDQTPATATSPTWPAGATTTIASMARDWTPGAGTSTANWHTSIISTGWDQGAPEKGTPSSYNGYSVSGTISQLNATTSGIIYIITQDASSTIYGIYQQNTTGTYQMHLFDSSIVSPSEKYGFFAYRDTNGNGDFDEGQEPRRFLDNDNNDYSLGQSGLSDIDFKIALDPVILIITPSETHIGDTVTISGMYFGQSTTTSEGKVYFPGGYNLEGQIVSWSGTAIQVVVPQNAQTGYVRVRLGGWADNQDYLTIRPIISSAVATDKSVVVNFDSYMDGERATNLANYTLYSPSGNQISLADAWTEFRGNKVYIKGISLTIGNYFRINPGSNLRGISGTTIDTNYYATGTIAAGPTISYVYKKGESTTTNYGSVGNTVVIVGSSFGSATGTLYLSPGKPTEGQPQEPISAIPSVWTLTSIEAVIPSGAKTGPVTVITAAGIESEFSRNAFFDILVDVNYRIFQEGTETSIPTSTARIVIGGMGGPRLHYVGDGNSTSPTTYNAGTKVYTVSNVSSEGFNWVFDSSGNYVTAKGQELDSSTTTTFYLTAKTTKISGTITNGGDSRTIVVWSNPVKGTGENMEWLEPIFVKTNSAGTVSYSLGFSATGTYMVGVEDPGFGAGAASSPRIAPSPQEVNASTTSEVTGIDFAFIEASRRIRGKIEKAEGKSFEIGPGMEAFHVWGYQPKENGLHASAMPDSSGYFDLYVNPGVYIVGVGGPDLPSPVEKQIEVLADDTAFATSNTVVDITLVIKAPDEYIQGQVTDSSGNSISGASIFAWSSTGTGGQAFTNSSGAYKLYISPGTYTVEGFAPNFGKLTARTGVEVADGCQTPGTCPVVDFGVSSELATISGTVKKNNASSSDMEVWVTQGETGYGINGTRTGTDGTFTLKVPYGSGYYLHVAQPGAGEIYKGSLPTFSSSATSTSVTVSVNTATINVQISPKTAFSKAFVEVYGSTGKGFSDKDSSASGDNFRKYSIEVPRPTSGNYTYTIKGGIPGYGPLTATTTSVGSGDTSKTISISLANIYTISGTISDPTTSTAANEAEGAFIWAASPTGHGGGEANASGTFSFVIKGGTYDIGIDKKNYVGNMFANVVVSGNATITDTYSLALTSAASTISGTVYKSGVAESGAWVWAVNGSGGWAGDETDGAGLFTLQVTAGSWAIRAASEGYEATSPQTVSAGASGVSIILSAIYGYTAEAPTVEPIAPKTGGIVQGDKVKIEAPEGALDSQDTNTGRMSIQKTTSIPKTNDVKALGNMAYEISVSNASGTPITILNDSITVTLTYDSSDLSAAGLTQSEALELSLGYFDSTLNKWVTIPTNAATTTGGGVIYTGTTKHLSPYAPLIPSGANPPSTPTGLTATAGDRQVTLSWTGSSEAKKYNIYRRSDSTYPYLTQVTATTYTNTGLTNGTTYYYKVSALNNDDDESQATEAVFATPSAAGGAVIFGGGTAPDTTAPSISNIQVTAGDTFATITWQTSESSISWIFYGTSTNYGLEKKTATYRTSHSVTLEDLLPETAYHYQLKSQDSDGNTGVYTDKTLTTLALGEVPEITEEEEEVVVTPAKPISEMTISELKAEIARISALITQLQAQLTQLVGVPGQLTANLKYDDRGDGVELLQTWLAKDKEVYPEGIVSGWFGPLTKAAVIRFQEKYSEDVLAPYGLSQGTGFVGKTTRAKLNTLHGGQ